MEQTLTTKLTCIVQYYVIIIIVVHVLLLHKTHMYLSANVSMALTLALLNDSCKGLFGL